MNQIIFYKDIVNDFKKVLVKKQKLYKVFFVLSIIILTISIIYYVFRFFKISKNAKISDKVLNAYDIQALYNSNNKIELPSILTKNGDMADIVGILEIEKINIRYPILSKYSDDFLEIALCKFAGNELNEYGNFCILGHNFSNGSFFSDLYLLDIGDIIKIYNINGEYVKYIVYDKFEIIPEDLSCTAQDYSIKEITLITCTNRDNKRLVIKAKEKR